MSGLTAAKSQQQKSSGQMETRSKAQSVHPAISRNYADVLELQQNVGNKAVHGLIEGGIPPVVQSVIKSGGQPLEPALRTQMESRFGQDFSQVRVHTDARAADSAEAVSAKAYTVGRDVVFGQGRFAPDTTEGKRLLAHEMAHVVQQSRGGNVPNIDPKSSLEQSAEIATSSATPGNESVSVQGSSGVGLARDENHEDPPTGRKY